jgi:chemotaxis protein methyltransferase CheR
MTDGFDFGDAEFRTMSGFLRGRFGLEYGPQKRAELEKACRRVRDGRGGSEFCSYVASPAGRELLQRLVNELTVGETYFFRIQAHFDALKNVILPGIVKRRAEEKRLRIWSAGCATGEEPYSVAMLILETVPDAGAWEIDFLATDINTGFIAAAREGRYREWSFRKVDDYWRHKYFKAVAGGWQISDEVRAMVRFVRANLCDDRDNVVAAGPAPFDLIVCRNVLIYFDDESIERVSRLFHRYLAPEGWYVGGHVEPLIFQDGFEPITFPGAVIYRKRPPAETVAAPKGRRPLEDRRAPRLKKPPADELARADRLVAAGEDDAALQQLSRLAAAREDGDLYWRLGRVLGNLGRYEEGLEWCRRAVEMDRENPFPYYIAALIQEELGKNDEAFENLRRSLYVDKNFVLGHFSMGNYHRWRRDEERAVRSYRNVMRLLESRAADEEISGDGLTAGRLREIVTQIL